MSPQKKLERHRVQFLIPVEIYQHVEEIAKKRNCTVTLIIIQALLKRIREEREYD